jgi:hypothetical protein
MAQTVEERLAGRFDEIRRIISSAGSAHELSAALFTPNGLFTSIATTRDERALLMKTPLFDEAQRKLTELQRQEARRFAECLR